MIFLRAKREALLTAEQFTIAVAAFPRLSENGKEAARRVLVDGIPQVQVAEDLKARRQHVNRWVKSIYGQHLKLMESNEGNQ